jgi:hypothetical protein
MTSATDFYRFHQGHTPEIELRPGLLLTLVGGRVVMQDASRRLVLSPQEASFLGVANLSSSWPPTVPTQTG